jgi:hypothetical protein
MNFNMDMLPSHPIFISINCYVLGGWWGPRPLLAIKNLEDIHEEIEI